MSVQLGQLTDEIVKELRSYTEDVADKVKEATTVTMKELVEATKRDAPRRTGKYRKAIKTRKTYEGRWERTETWYVDEPEHRLSHLLEDGHKDRNGKWVRGRPFIRENYAAAEAAFERRVKEAISGEKAK